MSQIKVTPKARAELLDHLLDDSKTYSIAFIVDGNAIQKDGQTKAEVIQQSLLYRHFQAFQPGELDLAGFEQVCRYRDKWDKAGIGAWANPLFGDTDDASRETTST